VSRLYRGARYSSLGSGRSASGWLAELDAKDGLLGLGEA